MEKKYKNIEAKLNDHVKTSYDKIVKKIIFLTIGGLILMVWMLAPEFKGIEYAFLHFNEYFDLGFVVIPFILIILLVKVLIKIVAYSENVISDIGYISGYIKHFSITTYLPNSGLVDNTYYYFDVVSYSKEITTVFISDIQNEVALSLLSTYAPNTLFEFEVAVLNPKPLCHKYYKDGSLILLPLDKYLPEQESNTSLTKINKTNWEAPLQFNHQPNFTLPRKQVNLDKKYDLICEHTLSPSMDFIPFKAKEKSRIKTLENQFDETIYEDMEINDVLYYTHEQCDDFRDFHACSKPENNIPNFLGYSLILYAINFLLLDLILELPNVFFQINILISGLLLLWGLKVTFIPLTINMPIRFHRRNKEIYVHKKDSLYKIPWDKSDISILAKENKSATSYYLILWLHPQFDVNKKSQKVVPLILYCSKATHGKTYFFWDYINRYMQYAPEFSLEKETPLLDAPKKKAAKEKITFTDILLLLLLSPLILISFIYVLSTDSNGNRLRKLLNPFRSRWPQKVHKWTGKVCDWY